MPAVSPQSSDRRFEGPLRAWEVIFLLALAASLLLAAAWVSSKKYLDNDELCTSLLVSNPSFSQMWNVIRHGGELNPPLYFVAEWLAVRVLGSGELALRALSAVSAVLAGWLLFFTVRPLTGPRIAALAVALVLGLSREAFRYFSTARYYSLFFLLVSFGVFLVMRFNADRPLKRHDYLLLFLAHWTMVYLHLFGLLYSGVLLLAMGAMDWLRGKLRWPLYSCVFLAWATFGAWLPFALHQVKVAGSYTPSGYHTIGYIVQWFDLQTPLGLVFVLVALLGGLALVLARPCPATEEANACVAPWGWTALVLLALGFVAVLFGTWLGSFVITALFMPRYVFPTTVAWVLIVALVLLAVCRLPRVDPPLQWALSPRSWNLAWFAVLAFCLFFQPLRAWKEPARPAAPFSDTDFGYKDLPILFENSWPYFVRAVYGRGRQYMLLIDHEAAQADPGWYTKFIESCFEHYYPSYPRMRVLHYSDLPDTFLAVDDDLTQTFDWFFKHHPEWTRQLLGSEKAEPDACGQQHIYLVQRVASGITTNPAR